LQDGIASRLLPEIALHPHQCPTRAQVGCKAIITRLAELAGYGGQEDAEFVLRHDAGVPSGGRNAILLHGTPYGESAHPASRGRSAARVSTVPTALAINAPVSMARLAPARARAGCCPARHEMAVGTTDHRARRRASPGPVSRVPPLAATAANNRDVGSRRVLLELGQAERAQRTASWISQF